MFALNSDDINYPHRRSHRGCVGEARPPGAKDGLETGIPSTVSLVNLIKFDTEFFDSVLKIVVVYITKGL